MKIKQYQSGGIVYLPTSNRREAAQTAASSSDDSKVPGFTKELIALVKENGLDSDVSTFLKQVERTLDLANDPTGQNLSMREILKVQRLASQVATNYKDYEKARQSLDEQDAWGEMATDKRGYLYVQNQDTGKIETVSHSSYTENPEKYLALTNEDVLNIRRADPTMAYRMDILDNISSAVGMKTITDYAKNLIKEFGKTSITGYSEKQAEKIRSGLEHIVAGDLGDFRGILTAGPDGVYKISSESTIADTGIKDALNYLVSTLPRNYQNTLGAKATVEGYSPEAMLMQMMYYNTDRTLSADYDQTASKSAGFGGGASEGNQSLTQGTLPDEISRGHLQQTTAYISPQAERVADTGMMAIAAWNGGPLTDEHKKRLSTNNLESLLPEIYGIRGADTSQITFGNQVVGDREIKALVWDGSSNIKRVALPKKIAPNGNIVPDLDLLTEYNKVLREVKDHPGMSKLEIREKLAKISDSVTFDENGNIIIKPEKMGIFLTFAAYANRDLLEIQDNSKPFLEKLNRTEGRALKDDYNKLVQYGKLDVTKKTPKIHDVSSARSNDFYYGNIYMPINDPTQGFMMSNEQYYTKDTFTNVAEKNYLNNVVQQNSAQDSWVYNYGE